jgi:hypothetical protein
VFDISSDVPVKKLHRWSAENLPMPGGWQTYRCDRCPLIFELGGFTAWDEAGVVYSETTQLACTSCGTMHRLSEENGVCHGTALSGPVRTSRMVKIQDGWGKEFEHEEWFNEADWLSMGDHPGGKNAISQLACTYCHQVGQMVSLRDFLYPDGYQPNVSRREQCPICLGPMECIGISDAI